MSEFPLVGQGGLENLVDSLGDVRVRLGQLAKIQQDCLEITEIELGVLPPSDIHEPCAQGRVRFRAAPEAECVRQGNEPRRRGRTGRVRGARGEPNSSGSCDLSPESVRNRATWPCRSRRRAAVPPARNRGELRAAWTR